MPRSWIRMSKDSSIATKAQDGHEYFQGYEIRKPEIDFSILDDSDIDEIFMLQAVYHYIITQKEFLSLDGKTQVLNIGVDDRTTNITTRLGHDMQVSQNAMRIALILSQKQIITERYRNVLLAQIMGISHDIGHTPFGHVGESAIAEYLQKFDMMFNHSSYGANLIETMIEDLEYRVFNIGEEHIDLRDEEARQFLEELKKEVAEAVKTHSTYYGSGVQHETIPQKATRLADGISYMVSDLSDLLRSDVKVVTRETLEKAYQSLGFEIGKDADLSFPEILDKLEQGGDALRDLQRTLLSEAFSRNRLLSETVITDDYKMLMDIKGFYPQMIKAETPEAYYQRVSREMPKEDKNKVMTIISRYYGYMLEMRDKDDYNPLLYNQDFVDRMNEIITQYSKELAIPDVTIDSRFKDKVISDRTIVEALDQKMSYIERIESITSPSIMALFAIQNKIQYQQILGDGEGQELNNHQEESKEKIKAMMDRVVKYAYAAIAFPEENCRGGQRPDINFHGGRLVPNIPFFLKSDLPKHVKAILEYATFVVQQMQNKDFESDESLQEVINQVAQELGIRRDKMKEIEKSDPGFDIIHKVRTEQKSGIKLVYKPKDIPLLVRDRGVTLEEFNDLSERTLSEVSDFIEDPRARVPSDDEERDIY